MALHKSSVDYSLYLVTDRDLMRAPDLPTAVEQAIQGGCTLVQLREKDAGSRQFYDIALSVKAVCDRHNVPLIVNDRIDIALAVDALGVHIGQSDIPAKIARKLIGPNKLLGVSATTPDEAMQAQRDGADYLGIGAMFSTDTKLDARLVSMDTLRQIRQSIDLPIVVIGGIGKHNAAHFAGAGIDGLAVVSAIIAQQDIAAAAAEMKMLFAEGNHEVRRRAD